MEFGEARERFLQGQLNANTRRTYAIVLARSPWSGREMTELTRNDLDEFEASELGRNVAPATKWHALLTLKSFLKWAAERDLTPLRSSMVRRYREPAAPAVRFLTEAALQRLLAAIEDPRDSALIRVMAGAGLRVSEALSLTATSVERSESGFRLRVSGKGSKVRVVPIHLDLGKALVACGDGPLFRSHDRGGSAGLTPAGVRHIVHAACDRAGIERINPHALRHTFAVRTFRAMKDLPKLRKLLGHVSLEMTARYVDHYDEADLRDSIPAL